MARALHVSHHFVSITFLSHLQPLQVAVDETPYRPADALSRLLLLSDPDDGRPASQRLFTAGNKLSLWCALFMCSPMSPRAFACS